MGKDSSDGRQYTYSAHILWWDGIPSIPLVLCRPYVHYHYHSISRSALLCCVVEE